MVRGVPVGCAGSWEWTAMFRTGCRGLRPRAFSDSGPGAGYHGIIRREGSEEEAWRRSQKNRRTA